MLKIGTRVLTQIVIFVFILSLISFIYSFQREKNLVMAELDKQLYTAARLTREILGNEYFNSIDGPDSVSTEQFAEMVDRFNRICSELELQYLWSLMEYGDGFVFTSSTSPDHNILNNKHARFFEVHTNPEAYYSAVETGFIQYQSITDKWGTIRVALIPLTDAHGRNHVIGASVEQSNIRLILQQTIRLHIFLSLMFIILGLLPSYILSRMLTKPFSRLLKSTSEIAGRDFSQKIPIFNMTGIPEEQALIGSFNKLSQSINTYIRDLSDSRENLNMTLQAIGDGVITTDNAGYVTRMNPVAENLTGWSIEDSLNRRIEEVFQIRDENPDVEVRIPVYKVIETMKTQILENPVLLTSREGTEYRIADSAAPIINTGGILVGVILVFRDITEEHQLQEQLNHSQRLDAVGQLAGGIAHDFNNMLGGILGATGLLRDDIDKNEQDELIDIIEDAGKRAADLTSQLLAFSRKQSIASTVFDLHNIIAKVTGLLEHSINKNIKITQDLKAKSYFIAGDPTQIQSTLLNMGINASHAMPGGGTLSFLTDQMILGPGDCRGNLSSLEPGEYIRVSICDTGCGISPDDLDKIFDPFYTTKETGKGTGLGLSAAYGTIRKHRGSIEVHSKLNEGTVFIMLLPVKDLPSRRMAPSEEVLFLKGEGHILVVDDEPVMRISCKKILEGSGYSVTTAVNGRQALELYEKNKEEYDLIILDMIMPEMEGKECFNRLKAINSSQKIIISSGFSEESEFTDLKRGGINGILRKPFNKQELCSLVYEVLAKS